MSLKVFDKGCDKTGHTEGKVKKSSYKVRGFEKEKNLKREYILMIFMTFHNHLIHIRNAPKRM